jgi:hypothetical protein
MRRRSASFVGVRRHRILILALPILLILAFLLRVDIRGIARTNLWSAQRSPRKDAQQSDAVPDYRVDKVSMLFGPNELFERALDTQRRHNRVFGYGLKVLSQPVTDGYWNKLLYLLSLITQELAKPAEDRIEWLM